MTAPRETFANRFYALPGLILTFILTIVLSYLSATGKSSSGGFYDYVNTHRASTQIVVQILSHLLGSLLVLTMVSLINFNTRLHLVQRTVSLDRLTWWNQLCNQRLSFALPWAYVVALILFYGLTLLPAALWAGAITPVISTTTLDSTISIPKYQRDPDNQYWNQSGTAELQGGYNTTSTPLGDFSFFPVFPYANLIMGSASSASVRNRIHSKYDYTRYAFAGRSYGVGSSVGLIGDVSKVSQLVQYSYEEVGYKTSVSCIVNETSDWKISLAYDSPGEGFPVSYWSNGSLPNSYPEPAPWYASLGLMSILDIVAYGYFSGNGRNMLAIASLGTGAGFDQNGPVQRYVFLDKIQCDVSFVARTFHISVDTNQHVINVDDVRAADESELDPSLAEFGTGLGIIPQRAMTQTGLLPFVYTSLFTSVVGDVFATNVQNAYQSKNVSQTDFSNTDVNLGGVAQTFESMFDDMLLGLSSAQLMLVPNGTVVVPALAVVGAIRFGNTVYTYSIMTLTFIIAGTFAVEAVRHNAWKQLGEFNYSNLSHVVTGSSQGGSVIGNLTSKRYRSWSGYAANQAAGRIVVKLSEIGGDIKLEAARAVSNKAVVYGTVEPADKENFPLVRTSSKHTSSQYQQLQRMSGESQHFHDPDPIDLITPDQSTGSGLPDRAGVGVGIGGVGGTGL